DMLTQERAEELFGDDAGRMLGSLLASSGPVRDALAATITGPQARRAALTHERLNEINESDLPDAWAAILIRAAATPRSSALHGREGILSPIEAQNAALAHRVLSSGERAAVGELVARAQVKGRIDASPAQALILKSLAARRAAFAELDERIRGQAIHEL